MHEHDIDVDERQDQRADTVDEVGLRSTRNDLAVARRERLVTLCNRLLADAIDLSLQAKQAHWNVKGPSFYGLHLLFDKVATEAGEAVDLLAERAVQLGGVAEGTLQSVFARTDLPEYPLRASSGTQHVTALSDGLARFCQLARAGIEAAEELGDTDTADILTEVSRASDKNLWMLEAHLQR